MFFYRGRLIRVNFDGPRRHFTSGECGKPTLMMQIPCQCLRSLRAAQLLQKSTQTSRIGFHENKFELLRRSTRTSQHTSTAFPSPQFTFRLSLKFFLVMLTGTYHLL